MSERDELLAEAERMGIPVDKRLGVDKLRAAIDEWDSEYEYDDELDPVDEAPAPVAVADDGWPKRIAPCAWLDQDGNRWTDLGQAGEAAERIRRR